MKRPVFSSMRNNAVMSWPSLAVTLTFCLLFILTRTSIDAMRIPTPLQSTNLTIAKHQTHNWKERHVHILNGIFL